MDGFEGDDDVQLCDVRNVVDHALDVAGEFATTLLNFAYGCIV